VSGAARLLDGVAALRGGELATSRLAADCLDWYRNDLYALASMAPEEVEATVCDYLSKREWYRRRTASGDAQ